AMDTKRRLERRMPALPRWDAGRTQRKRRRPAAGHPAREAQTCRQLLLFALMGLLLSVSGPAAPQPGNPAAPALDPQRDARLATDVTLRSEAIPLRRVIRALSQATGVGLEVPGAEGSERLVAFAR